ncbi:MAG: hypothetical protein IMY71_00620 [Bacteroidetes bacterium]|nr:hypothetical protein [Bacteroidota bacterium]
MGRWKSGIVERWNGGNKRIVMQCCSVKRDEETERGSEGARERLRDEEKRRKEEKEKRAVRDEL